MTLIEAIEYGIPSVVLAQDAEWCEVALETMKKYKKLISENSIDIDVEKFENDKRFQSMVRLWGRKIAIEKYTGFGFHLDE